MTVDGFAGKGEVVGGDSGKIGVLLEVVGLGSDVAHKESIHTIAAGGVN